MIMGKRFRSPTLGFSTHIQGWHLARLLVDATALSLIQALSMKQEKSITIVSTDTKLKNFSLNYLVDSDRVLSIEEEFQ